MSEFIAPAYSGVVAIAISLPASGSAAKLIDLLAQGTVLTPSADLPPEFTNANAKTYLSATVDNGGVPAITGSSPLTRHFAERAAQVIIENHGASFDTDWSSAMSGTVVRASGTPYTTPAGTDAARRVYIQSHATEQTVTAVLLVSRQAVAGL